MDHQLTMFSVPPTTASRPRWMGPCQHPIQPQHMAAAHPDDAADAVGMKDVDYCCAIHYVRFLRYKYDLDAGP